MRRLVVIVAATSLVALMSTVAATALQGGADRQLDRTEFQLEEIDGLCDQSYGPDRDRDRLSDSAQGCVPKDDGPAVAGDQVQDRDRVRDPAQDCVREGDDPAAAGDQVRNRDRDRNRDRVRTVHSTADCPGGCPEHAFGTDQECAPAG